jgi:hypothetical protein
VRTATGNIALQYEDFDYERKKLDDLKMANTEFPVSEKEAGKLNNRQHVFNGE